MPIMIYNFNTLSLSFIISNLLAGSLVGVIVLYAFSLIFCSFILGKLIILLFTILNFLVYILLAIAHICARLPFSSIIIPTPKKEIIFMFYFLLILLKYIDCKDIKVYKKINIKKCIISSIVIVIILNFILPIILSKSKNLVINFIDVSQGDSTLIRVDNKNVLIDGGGSLYSDNFDVGEKVLFPYLLDRGICKLDYILVSHFDADHCQGLTYILENMKVKNVIISSLGQNSKEYNDFINLAKKKNINIIYVKKGDKVRLGKAIIEILYPDNEEITDNAKNNNAIVCRLMWNDISILFTGDIEDIAEEKILKIYDNNLEKLKSTILKVAHHGSKTSSTSKFLEAVKPKIALIGVGKNNNFGHPNEGVIERLEKINCKIYRTDINGEIEIKANKTLKIKTMKTVNI